VARFVLQKARNQCHKVAWAFTAARIREAALIVRRVTTIRGSFKTLDIDRYLGQIVVELMVPSPQATNNGVRN
jgi:hypothetical protein